VGSNPTSSASATSGFMELHPESKDSVPEWGSYAHADA
jgi:hypothetical protein